MPNDNSKDTTASSAIYLDYNATTPVDPRVADVIVEHLVHGVCGNPSSSHLYGREAKEEIRIARHHVGRCLECQPKDLVFTSGATESLNLALKGASVYQREHGVGNRIIVSEVEHPAVYEIATFLETEGFEICRCPVNSEGIVDLLRFGELLKEGNVAVVSIIHANAEIGSIQPVHQLIRMVRDTAPKALFHIDASQTVGKIPVSIRELQPDLMTITGHKFYAPKGVGCLYVKKREQLVPQIHGAGQEGGLRGGTENLLLIPALGEACRLVDRYWKAEMEAAGLTAGCSHSKSDERSFDPKFQRGANHLRKMRQLLQTQLIEHLALMKQTHTEYYRINGPRDEELRLPNTLSMSFRGLCGPEIVSKCPEVAFGAGSACHSSEMKMSDVLVACRVNPEFGNGTIRMTTGRFSTPAEMTACAQAIAMTIGRLYGWINTPSSVPSSLEQDGQTEATANTICKNDNNRPWCVDWRRLRPDELKVYIKKREGAMEVNDRAKHGATPPIPEFIDTTSIKEQEAREVKCSMDRRINKSVHHQGREKQQGGEDHELGQTLQIEKPLQNGQNRRRDHRSCDAFSEEPQSPCVNKKANNGGKGFILSSLTDSDLDEEHSTPTGC